MKTQQAMQFTISVALDATMEQVFTAWLDSDLHREMIGDEATAGKKEGDAFTAFGDYISGHNVALTPNSQIVQSWRTSEFSDNEEDSLLRLDLAEKGGKTVLTLSHSNLPAHGMQYRQGWQDHYFGPMKAFFENRAAGAKGLPTHLQKKI